MGTDLRTLLHHGFGACARRAPFQWPTVPVFQRADEHPTHRVARTDDARVRRHRRAPRARRAAHRHVVRRHATRSSTTPRCCWSRWWWSATRGPCCRTPPRRRRSTSSSTPSTCRRSCWSPATCPGSFTFTRRNLHKLVTTIVGAVPRLRDAAGAVPHRASGHEDFGMLYLSPHWPMWYLTALFLWRLATPLLQARCRSRCVRWRSRSAWSAALNTVDALDLPRTLGLLPFFVAGLVMTPPAASSGCARPRVRVVAVGLLVAAFVVATIVDGHFSKEWLYWRTGYPDLDVPFWLGGVCPAGAAAGGRRPWRVSALSLVPRSQRWFTPLGLGQPGRLPLPRLLREGRRVRRRGRRCPSRTRSRPSCWSPAARCWSRCCSSATPVSRRLNRLVDPISTLTADMPGALRPHAPPDETPGGWRWRTATRPAGARTCRPASTTARARSAAPTRRPAPARRPGQHPRGGPGARVRARRVRLVHRPALEAGRASPAGARRAGRSPQRRSVAGSTYSGRADEQGHRPPTAQVHRPLRGEDPLRTPDRHRQQRGARSRGPARRRRASAPGRCRRCSPRPPGRCRRPRPGAAARGPAGRPPRAPRGPPGRAASRVISGRASGLPQTS